MRGRWKHSPTEARRKMTQQVTFLPMRLEEDRKRSRALLCMTVVGYHGLLGARVQGKQECSAPLYQQASLRQRAPSRYRGYFPKSCRLRRKEPAVTLSAVISHFYSAVLFWMGRTGYLPATSDADNLFLMWKFMFWWPKRQYCNMAAGKKGNFTCGNFGFYLPHMQWDTAGRHTLVFLKRCDKYFHTDHLLCSLYLTFWGNVDIEEMQEKENLVAMPIKYIFCS